MNKIVALGWLSNVFAGDILHPYNFPDLASHQVSCLQYENGYNAHSCCDNNDKCPSIDSFKDAGCCDDPVQNIAFTQKCGEFWDQKSLLKMFNTILPESEATNLLFETFSDLTKTDEERSKYAWNFAKIQNLTNGTYDTNENSFLYFQESQPENATDAWNYYKDIEKSLFGDGSNLETMQSSWKKALHKVPVMLEDISTHPSLSKMIPERYNHMTYVETKFYVNGTQDRLTGTELMTGGFEDYYSQYKNSTDYAPYESMDSTIMHFYSGFGLPLAYEFEKGPDGRWRITQYTSDHNFQTSYRKNIKELEAWNVKGRLKLDEEHEKLIIEEGNEGDDVTVIEIETHVNFGQLETVMGRKRENWYTGPKTKEWYAQADNKPTPYGHRQFMIIEHDTVRGDNIMIVRGAAIFTGANFYPQSWPPEFAALVENGGRRMIQTDLDPPSNFSPGLPENDILGLKMHIRYGQFVETKHMRQDDCFTTRSDYARQVYISLSDYSLPFSDYAPAKPLMFPTASFTIKFTVFANPTVQRIAIAGGAISNGNPSQNVVLSRVNGTTDKWSGTYELVFYYENDQTGDVNMFLYYTILASTNTGSEWGWGMKEDISGQECAAPENYNDRSLNTTAAPNSVLELTLTYGACSGLPPSPPSSPPSFPSPPPPPSTPPSPPTAPSTDTILNTWELDYAKVGPVGGSDVWWGINREQALSQRPCLADDMFTFASGNVFNIDLGTETWLESWQGVAEGCGAPIAPHVSASHSFSIENNKLTIIGEGAFILIPKLYNGGEGPNPNGQVVFNIEKLTSTKMELTLVTNEDVMWTLALQVRI